MKPLQTFRSYYLPTFISMLVLFGIKFVFGVIDEEKRERVTSVEGILLLVGLVFGLSILIGGIYHGYDAYIVPRRVKRHFRKLKDLDLAEFGLSPNEENESLDGHYNGYYLSLLPFVSLNSGEGVSIHAFIIAEEEQVGILEKLESTYELNTDDEGMFWFTTQVKANWRGNFSGEAIGTAIRKLVGDLIQEGIKPLEVTD